MEKHDPNDDINSMSQQFQSITTVDPNLNINEQQQSANDTSTMPRYKNSVSMNSINERKKKSCSLDDNWCLKDLPGKNLPERILFVVDTAKEWDCTFFETRAGAKYAPLYMIKRILEIFTNAKSGMHREHEYALMTLNAKNPMWIGDYTNDHKTFMSYLEKIREDPIREDQPIFDLGPCFEMINDNVRTNDTTHPPAFVSRVILIYARSHCIPLFSTKRYHFENLCKNSHFYLDSLYVHEPLSDENNCQDIYSKLGNLDANQTSYILEAGRTAATLHTNMAKLMAHPLQRAKQDDSPYTFYNAGNWDVCSN